MFFDNEGTFEGFEGAKLGKGDRRGGEWAGESLCGNAGWGGKLNYTEETVAHARRLRTMLWSMPPLLTVKQLAMLTGEHIGSIRRGIADGRIPADKVNGRWYIPTPFLLEHTYAFLSDLGGGSGDDDGFDQACCVRCGKDGE